MYYNRNYKRLKLNDMEYLNSGQCAMILHNKDVILKKYYSETGSKNKLDEKMFDILKSINNPHFIELLDIYSSFNFIKLLKNKFGISPFSIDAYTAKYYPDDSVNVLFEHKDYILDNFKELENLFKIFSENMICTDDVKRKNSVIGKNGIIIIDPDLFYTVKSPRGVSKLNNKNLLKLFRDILINSFELGPDYEKNKTFVDSKIVNIKVTANTDITYEISKKLRYVRKPVELFRK